jgi:prevent-host-death family protein
MVAAIRWQLQDAKQRFSELIRAARTQGPQVVRRHGEDVAVVLDIADHRHLKGETVKFKDYLQWSAARHARDWREMSSVAKQP